VFFRRTGMGKNEKCGDIAAKTNFEFIDKLRQPQILRLPLFRYCKSKNGLF